MFHFNPMAKPQHKRYKYYAVKFFLFLGYSVEESARKVGVSSTWYYYQKNHK